MKQDTVGLNGRDSVSEQPKNSGNENTTIRVASKTEIISLVRRQNYSCALTGELLVPEDAALDHVVALTEGGTSTADNLQIVSKEINQMKGTLSNDLFVALCCKVADFSRRS